MTSACTIIPTTGSSTLYTCVLSALEQTYTNTTVLVVIDGPQYAHAVHQQLSSVLQHPQLKILQLPSNTGGNGFYGHRIYAAASFIVNEDLVLYLDQDNWFDQNHVQLHVETMQRNNSDWTYSLRAIHDLQGTHVADDNCESLGRWPIYISDNHYLVDTSCYCVPRDIIVKIGHAWYGGWGADRQFYNTISHYFKNYHCTGHHSLHYRLDGNPNSVTADFFIQGNRVMQQRYPHGLPWHMV